VENVKTWQQ